MNETKYLGVKRYQQTCWKSGFEDDFLVSKVTLGKLLSWIVLADGLSPLESSYSDRVLSQQSIRKIIIAPRLR